MCSLRAMLQRQLLRGGSLHLSNFVVFFVFVEGSVSDLAVSGQAGLSGPRNYVGIWHLFVWQMTSSVIQNAADAHFMLGQCCRNGRGLSMAARAATPTVLKMVAREAITTRPRMASTITHRGATTTHNSR